MLPITVHSRQSVPATSCCGADMSAAPATDDDIAKMEARTFTVLDITALRARIDLEVAGRKDDAERIRGLAKTLSDLQGYAILDFCKIQPDKRSYKCGLCDSIGPGIRTVQHAPSCLLWKGPTE